MCDISCYAGRVLTSSPSAANIFIGHVKSGLKQHGCNTHGNHDTSIVVKALVVSHEQAASKMSKS